MYMYIYIFRIVFAVNLQKITHFKNIDRVSEMNEIHLSNQKQSINGQSTPHTCKAQNVRLITTLVRVRYSRAINKDWYVDKIKKRVKKQTTKQTSVFMGGTLTGWKSFAKQPQRKLLFSLALRTILKVSYLCISAGNKSTGMLCVCVRLCSCLGLLIFLSLMWTWIWSLPCLPTLERL